MKMASMATLAIEFLLGLLMLLPFYHAKIRYAIVLIGVALHAGFFIFMDLGIFPIVDIISLVPFIPSGFWNRIYSPAIRPVNDIRFKYAHLINGSRNAFLAICLFSVLAYNMKTFVKNSPTGMWSVAIGLCNVFDLSQRWAMFSVPSNGVEWINIVGVDSNQKSIKVAFVDSYVSDEPPRHGIKMYSNHRVQLYVDAIIKPKYSNHRREFLKWICSNRHDYQRANTNLDSLFLITYKKENSYLGMNIPVKVDTLERFCCKCTTIVSN
jgi:hypothetical protein